jgi:protein-disulfide isomerase
MNKQARVHTQEMRRAQQARAAKQSRRRRVLFWFAALLIAGLVAAITVAIVQAAGRDRSLPEVAGKVVAPQHLTDGGAIGVGSPDAPVTVEIYYDYMCPACGAFDAANSGELSRLVADGTARIELRPIAFLDQQSSGTEYSSRTASAIAVVADAAPDHVWDFHTALYAHQPAEGSQGLSDEQVAAVATDAGVPADVVDQFSEGVFRPWVASVTKQAFDSGVTGTPTVKIDGEVFEGNAFVVGPLTKAIESAAAGQ